MCVGMGHMCVGAQTLYIPKALNFVFDWNSKMEMDKKLVKGFVLNLFNPSEPTRELIFGRANFVAVYAYG